MNESSLLPVRPASVTAAAARADHYIQPAATQDPEIYCDGEGERGRNTQATGREREYGLRPPGRIPTHFLRGARQRDGGMEGGLVSYLFI